MSITNIFFCKMFRKRYLFCTPSRRFLTYFCIFEKFKLKKRFIANLKHSYKQEFTARRHLNSCGFKKLRHYPNVLTHRKVYQYLPYICINFYKRTYQKLQLSYFKSLFNLECFIPTSHLTVPGFLYYFTPRSFFNIQLWPQNHIFMPLSYFMFNVPISYIQNLNLSKWTYAKSVGVICFRHEGPQSIKLQMIRLPSKTLKYCSKFTLCLNGVSSSLLKKWLIEGKWSSPLKKKFKTIVRGVAMNPVDHPNGGRTKSKQPEKTPWGTLAKIQK